MAGYSFFGDVIYVIPIAHKEALEIYKEVKHHPCPFSLSKTEDFPAPSAIYFKTEESWFGLRFHNFEKNAFMIHRMKPMYMDEETLKRYTNVYHHSDLSILQKKEI